MHCLSALCMLVCMSLRSILPLHWGKVDKIKQKTQVWCHLFSWNANSGSFFYFFSNFCLHLSNGLWWWWGVGPRSPFQLGFNFQAFYVRLLIDCKTTPSSFSTSEASNPKEILNLGILNSPTFNWWLGEACVPRTRKSTWWIGIYQGLHLVKIS